MCIYIYVCVCVNIILYMHVLGFSSVFIWDLCCCIVCAYMGREWTQHSGQVWVREIIPTTKFPEIVVHFGIPYKTTIWGGVAIIRPIFAKCFLIWSAKVSRSLGFAIFIHQKTRCRLKTKNAFTHISNSMHSDAQNDRPKVVTFQYSINGSWLIENQIEPTATSSCSRSIWISMLGSRIDWSN